MVHLSQDRVSEALLSVELQFLVLLQYRYSDQLPFLHLQLWLPPLQLLVFGILLRHLLRRRFTEKKPNIREVLKGLTTPMSQTPRTIPTPMRPIQGLSGLDLREAPMAEMMETMDLMEAEVVYHRLVVLRHLLMRLARGFLPGFQILPRF